MKYIRSPILYLVAAPLATLAMLFLHDSIPVIQLSLFPTVEENVQLFSDNNEPNGNSTVDWVDRSKNSFRCHLKQGTEYPYCGLVRILGKSLSEGINLSQYEGFKIKLKYTGEQSRLRLTVRHYNKEFGHFNKDIDDAARFNKYNSLAINSDDFNNEVDIKLSEFSVTNWWIDRFNIPREFSYPEFSNSVDFTIDIPTPVTFGEHNISLEKITFYGPLITKEKWYLSIVIFWIVIILTSAVVRIIILNRKAAADARRLQDSIAYNEELKKRARKFETLSNIDGLTGALNRHGISRYLSRFYPQNRNIEPIAIAIIDLDHFKHINDLYGHDGGDLVLKGTVEKIQQHMRGTDRIGRWGGEEFVLLCPHTDAEQIFSMCDNLRLLIEAQAFGEQNTIHVTMSVGVGLSNIGESFEQTFQRIDKALYKAKHSGRNRVFGVK